MVIINKQKKKMNLRFNLNVEFKGISGFLTKNPLTMQKIDCIMISASEIFAATAEPKIKNNSGVSENRRVVYVYQRSNS